MFINANNNEDRERIPFGNMKVKFNQDTYLWANPLCISSFNS